MELLVVPAVVVGLFLGRARMKRRARPATGLDMREAFATAWQVPSASERRPGFPPPSYRAMKKMK